jgi:hypothetical protein
VDDGRRAEHRRGEPDRAEEVREPRGDRRAVEERLELLDAREPRILPEDEAEEAVPQGGADDRDRERADRQRGDGRQREPEPRPQGGPARAGRDDGDGEARGGEQEQRRLQQRRAVEDEGVVPGHDPGPRRRGGRGGGERQPRRAGAEQARPRLREEEGDADGERHRHVERPPREAGDRDPRGAAPQELVAERGAGRLVAGGSPERGQRPRGEEQQRELLEDVVIDAREAGGRGGLRDDGDEQRRRRRRPRGVRRGEPRGEGPGRPDDEEAERDREQAGREGRSKGGGAARRPHRDDAEQVEAVGPGDERAAGPVHLRIERGERQPLGASGHPLQVVGRVAVEGDQLTRGELAGRAREPHRRGEGEDRHQQGWTEKPLPGQREAICPCPGEARIHPLEPCTKVRRRQRRRVLVGARGACNDPASMRCELGGVDPR